MLSRTAESLYWIGRYLERVQDLARAVDIAFQSRLEQPRKRDERADWEALLRIGGEHRRFADAGAAPDPRTVARFMIFDLDNPNSIQACLRTARDNANGMRDRITSEMWEVLNTFYMWLRERSGRHEKDLENLHALCTEIKDRCFLFQGTAQGTMVHDDGWQFFRVGQFLERATITARTLEMRFPLLLADTTAGSHSLNQWIWLLRSLSGYESYSKAFHMGLRPQWVLEFLIYDRQFPRSIQYSVSSAQSSLFRIPDDPTARGGNHAKRVLGSFQATLAYGDRSELTNDRLYPFLKDIQARCADVSTQLKKTYFTYEVAGATA